VSEKPLIFISYSHKDEPEHPRDGEIQWLSFVRTYLQPAVKHGIVELWVDRDIAGGADWNFEIEENLRACDIFILLVSANSMASDYIVDREIAIVRDRQALGDNVHFYPLLLTPTPNAGLAKVRDMGLRPRDAKPLSGYSPHDRAQHMSDIADEIAEFANQIGGQRRIAQPRKPRVHPPFVHITGLPETAYERLVGRENELKWLDHAWADGKTNILSLVAEGGAGKSALVNEWLERMRTDNYRGAEVVLGWSFYNQGTKERATSAEPFLNWAVEKLGIDVNAKNATAEGEAIAETLARRRVLLLLDGIEPLQHGLDQQQGELKDEGLRALLRRFASMPPADRRGLVVLTSRLQVKELAGRKGGSAPILEVNKLSDQAGAALLRDNGVWGTSSDLQAAVRAFGGHALALALLASFLKETQFGDVRRRDHIGELLEEPGAPGQSHARRVMESYEREWLSGQPVHFAIMRIVGLFDRPASGECLFALRQHPIIPSLTDEIINLNDDDWWRAVARLRDVRLLAPKDISAPDALDAHPLVREWFGQKLELTNPSAWRAAHGRLFDYLREKTDEGPEPTLESLAPLYQAIAHGCRAHRYAEALEEIYVGRICRRKANGEIEFYSSRKLAAAGSDLAAISWFFEKPYDTPVPALTLEDQSWVLHQAALQLQKAGRFAEGLPAHRAGLRMVLAARNWTNSTIGAYLLSQEELLLGEVAAAVSTAEQAIAYARQSKNKFQMLGARAVQANALHAAGRRNDAERVFADAERRQLKHQPEFPLLYSRQGYFYCELLLAKGDWIAVRDRAIRTLEWAKSQALPLDVALDMLSLGRAHLGLALRSVITHPVPDTAVVNDARAADFSLNDCIDRFRRIGRIDDAPRGLLARAAFRRSIGDWDRATQDLDDIEEIAEPGPMRLFLCDMALERARIALARADSFAPLNGTLEGRSPPKPVPPNLSQGEELKAGAEKQLAIASDFIDKCGYYKRKTELAELQAVLRGDRGFASLPPRP
jgi:hypothetical protein